MNKRHVFFWKLLRPLAHLFVHLKFGYRCEIARNLPENYIVLANHVTDFDPVFVSASFPRQMYFVASEHIARWPRLYPLIKYLLEPIIRYKGTVASSTVLDMMRKLKHGQNVCLFAEGARSWDGVTAPILASTGKVVKSAKCGLVTYRIEGGYFASPNWSQGGTRRGRVYGHVVNVYTAEQLAQMSVDEINRIITDDLHEDAYARQLENPVAYKGKQIAYKMENLLFCCPKCGKTDTMVSKADTVKCTACGLSFRYTPYGMLEGIEQKTVKELFAWLRQVVYDHAAADGVYTAQEGKLMTIDKHQETLVDEGTVELSRTMLRCGKTEIPLSEISDMAMHGRRSLVLSAGKVYYDLMIPNDNTLKFHMLYQVYKNGSMEHYEGRIR